MMALFCSGVTVLRLKHAIALTEFQAIQIKDTAIAVAIAFLLFFLLAMMGDNDNDDNEGGMV